MDNPIIIHTEKIKGTAFGDPRLVKRGRKLLFFRRRSASLILPCSTQSSLLIRIVL